MTLTETQLQARVHFLTQLALAEELARSGLTGHLDWNATVLELHALAIGPMAAVLDRDALLRSRWDRQWALTDPEARR